MNPVTKKVEFMTHNSVQFTLKTGQIIMPRCKTIAIATLSEILWAIKNGVIVSEIIPNGTRIRLTEFNYDKMFADSYTKICDDKKETVVAEPTYVESTTTVSEEVDQPDPEDPENDTIDTEED